MCSAFQSLYWTIRIFNDCDVRIENSVTRVTVWHHEACRAAMPSDGIFNSHRTTIMDSFSRILFLPQLNLNMNMRYFINFTLNISICSQELIGSVPVCDVDVETYGEK